MRDDIRRQLEDLREETAVSVSESFTEGFPGMKDKLGAAVRALPVNAMALARMAMALRIKVGDSTGSVVMLLLVRDALRLDPTSPEWAPASLRELLEDEELAGTETAIDALIIGSAITGAHPGRMAAAPWN